MKELKWIFTLTFLLALQIYASPANDTLELTATFCHFADSSLKCSCSEETKEVKKEQERTTRKLRRQNF
ncbi:hypothetical protein [Salinimicrobium xinjiangense]|uniref:hypothetical protein n=1 Tax=Salinimicrobium xinjiangense TaxID=438596 RepID=UPI0003FC0341|nr:hypothetical protein [Salinimicrobium xinjiangense]